MSFLGTPSCRYQIGKREAVLYEIDLQKVYKTDEREVFSTKGISKNDTSNLGLVLLQEKLISIREAVPYYRHIKKDAFVYGRYLLRDTSVNEKDLEKDLLVFVCKKISELTCIYLVRPSTSSTVRKRYTTLLYSRRGPVPYI